MCLNSNIKEPYIIEGGIFEDHRGTLEYVNAFDFPDVKRFYIISNNDEQTFRAWQGHRVEAKYFYPLEGAFDVFLIKVDDWDNPSPKIKPVKFSISSDKPCILVAPPGYANGIKALTDNSKLLVFSTSKIDNAENIKFPQDYWGI